MIKPTIFLLLLFLFSCKTDKSKFVGEWLEDSKAKSARTLRIIKYEEDLITSTDGDVQTLKYNSERDEMLIQSSYFHGCFKNSLIYHVKYLGNLDKLYIRKEYPDEPAEKESPEDVWRLYSRVSN